MEATAQQHTRQQKAPWCGRPIDSVEMVFEAIKYLTAPIPSREAISLISTSQHRGRFKRALEECLQLHGNKEVGIETKRFLVGLTACCSDEMKQSLTKLGYPDINTEIMIHIGASNGMSFRSAVNAALVAEDPNNQAGLELVDNAIQEAAKAIGVPVGSRREGAAVARPALGENAHKPDIRPDPVSKRPSGDAPAAKFTEEHEQPGRAEAPQYRSTHVYGSEAALCFNAGVSRKKHHVIQVDAALLRNGKFDWEHDALTIQLDHKELTLLYGVLVGWRNSCKFDAHGEARDKVLEIERQEGKFYLNAYAKGKKRRAVQMNTEDAIQVMNLTLTQIVKEAPEELRGHPTIIIHLMKEAHNIRPVVDA